MALHLQAGDIIIRMVDFSNPIITKLLTSDHTVCLEQHNSRKNYHTHSVRVDASCMLFHLMKSIDRLGFPDLRG